MNETITLLPITPSTPLVVCDAAFLGTLTTVEKSISELVVRDAVSAQAAADIQQRLTTAGRKLEAARVALKEPFLAKGREIDAAAKVPAARIEKAKDSVRGLILEYSLRLEKERAEAEAKRQEELRRLESIRLEEERAAKAKADELAKQVKEAAAKSHAQAMDLDFDEQDEPQKTDTEKAIEAVKFAPSNVAAKPTGVSFKCRLRIKSIDITQLPWPFITKTANEALIRSTYCTGWQEGAPIPIVPGVLFEIDKQVVSTGRSVF